MGRPAFDNGRMAGIEITEASGVTIGGTAPGAGNVISGNPAAGVDIVGSWSPEDRVTSGNLVEGNRIGTNAAGTASVPNAIAVQLNTQVNNKAVTGNTIGGTTPGAGNTISGDVLLDGPLVTGNLIAGNTARGVTIENGAADNTVGGTTLAARNVLTSVIFQALGEDASAPPSGNAIEGNFISGNFAGPLFQGPPYSGVVLRDATNNTIGGTAPGAGNVILGNAEAGVVVVGNSVGDAIEGNSISGNGGLGIQLGETGTPLANTPGGPHAGPNALQNHPVLATATVAGGQTTIAGTLNSTPTQSFRVEFFSNPSPDPSGFGEGKTFLGALDVTTDANGNAPLTFIDNADLTGQDVTATATHAGDTSEFSNDLPVPYYPAPIVHLGNPPLPVAVGPFTLIASVTPGPGLPVATGTIHFFDATTGTDLGTATLSYEGVSLVSPTLLAGPHTIVATYSGDSHYPASSASETIDVLPAATATALTAAPGTSVTGQPVTLTASVNPSFEVTTPAYPPTIIPPDASAPVPAFTGTVTFWDGTTALATVPVAPNGRATFTTSALGAGTHPIVARYSGDANYGASASSAATVTVAADTGPTVLSVQRYGIHTQPTAVVLTFSAPLDHARARNVANYQIIGPGGRVVPVSRALYNAANDRATLWPARPLNLHARFRLTVAGTGSHAITDAYGNRLDGANDGRPGSDFRTLLTARDLVLGHAVPGGPKHRATKAEVRAR